MVLKLEEGKFYRTRDGRTVGPMERAGRGGWTEKTTGYEWMSGDGKHCSDDTECPFDLVSEQGPVRTVTRKVIVPGVYGRLAVELRRKQSHVDVAFDKNIGSGGEWASMEAADLRATAATLIEIADALESPSHE